MKLSQKLRAEIRECERLFPPYNNMRPRQREEYLLDRLIELVEVEEAERDSSTASALHPADQHS